MILKRNCLIFILISLIFTLFAQTQFTRALPLKQHNINQYDQADEDVKYENPDIRYQHRGPIVGIVNGAADTAASQLKNMVNVIIHPVETLKNLTRVIANPFDSVEGYVKGWRNILRNNGLAYTAGDAGFQVGTMAVPGGAATLSLKAVKSFGTAAGALGKASLLGKSLPKIATMSDKIEDFISTTSSISALNHN